MLFLLQALILSPAPTFGACLCTVSGIFLLTEPLFFTPYHANSGRNSLKVKGLEVGKGHGHSTTHSSQLPSGVSNVSIKMIS